MNVFELSAILTLDTSRYENSLRGAENQAKKAGGGFTVLKGAMANLVSGGINMVAGALTNNLGSAFARVDTLNNYSVVMSNLGKDSGEAQQAIDDLAEGIDGLPTKLDAIASVQQQFAALGGPLTDATDLTIALNNATLAGGRGQEIANSAMQQWYQMIAAGKSDQMSMRIINEAMPAQLDAIAKSVVGANATWKQLDDEWKKNPEITEKVKDAIIELNEKGSNGIASFEDQAKAATQGIQTSMTNLQTAITKGMANMMQKTGLDKFIGGQLSNVTDAINKSFDFIIGFSTNDTYGQSLANMVFRLGVMIQDALPDAVNGVVAKAQELLPDVLAQAQSIFETLKDVVFNGFGALFQNLPDFTAMLGQVFGAVLNSITGLITDIIASLPNLISGLNNAFPSIRDTIITALSGIRDSVFEILDSVIANLPAFAENLMAFVEEQIPVWIQQGQTLIISFAEGIYERIPDVVNTVADLIPKIVSFIIRMAPKVLTAGTKLMGKLGVGFWKALPRILPAVARLGLAIVRGILRLAGQVLGAGVKLVASLAGGIAKSAGKLLTAGLKLAGKVVKGIGDGIKGIANVGGNIVKGIWNGISNGYDWITGKIKSWIGNVTNFIKNVLGIESPSKVMAKEVGKWIPLGIAKGIEDNASAVDDALEDAMDIPDMADGLVDTGSLAGGIKMVSLAPNITVDGAENPEEYAQRFMREMKMEARMA